MRGWSGNGAIALSHARLVFIAASPTGGFRAYDFPLAYLYNESFRQPIFGCNHLALACRPVLLPSGPGLSPPPPPPPRSARIYFLEGGVGTFLPLFFGMLADARRWGSQPPAAQLTPEPPKRAFVDPSDPTVLYIPTP